MITVKYMCPRNHEIFRTWSSEAHSYVTDYMIALNQLRMFLNSNNVVKCDMEPGDRTNYIFYVIKDNDSLIFSRYYQSVVFVENIIEEYPVNINPCTLNLFAELSNYIYTGKYEGKYFDLEAGHAKV